MSKHAKRGFQPSSFYRTIRCPGWWQYCEKAKIPEQKSSEYAMEGTIAHFIADQSLENGWDAKKWIGAYGVCGNDPLAEVWVSNKSQKNHFQVLMDEEFCEHVQTYLDHVRASRKKTVRAMFFNEQRVDLGWIVRDMSGTADSQIIEPLGILDVTDLKFGKGVAVEVGDKPGDNVQLSIYALGAIGPDNENAVEIVRVTIVQPRKHHPDGPIRSIEYNVDELIDWGEKVLRPAGEAALKSDAPLCSGNWCRWCDAEAVCPQLRKDNLRAMFGEATEEGILDGIAPVQGHVGLETAKLAKISALKKRIESWLSAVDLELFDRIKLSGPDCGLKVVQGYGRRTWVDPKEAYRLLRNDKYSVWAEAKLLTPPQMEKRLKTDGGLKLKEAKAIIKPLTHSPIGDLKLVVESDKRSAIAAVDEMFK